ncbi:OmpA family protein [Vibrio sp. Evd11]|uniref:OmpA family protein n=1 Tax=Vibrio sp. Evd11 TaxID=1207404 RepID=UPI000EFA553D|nr:OmpA family protein [Vibrio sp. Evd11]
MRLVYKFLKAGVLLCSALATGANAEVLHHDSNPYLNDQYEIIKYMFIDLEVSKPSDKEVRIVIPTDYGFQTGKFHLKRPMKDKLRQLSKVLNDYPESTIDVVGHTDSIGKESANMLLGQRRAESVSKVLLEGKVNPYRIDTFSEGEELPKCSNASKEGRECNRRVELYVMLEKELARF